MAVRTLANGNPRKLSAGPEHIRITIDSSNKAVKCSQKAMRFFPGKMDFVEVPYENTTLPTYFWRSGDSKSPARTLIVHSGFDGAEGRKCGQLFSVGGQCTFRARRGRRPAVKQA